MEKKAKQFDIGTTGTVNFNVLMIGQPGCGKTTFLRSFTHPYLEGNSNSDGGCLVGESGDCFVHMEERSVDKLGDLRNYLLKKHQDFREISKQLMTEQEQIDTDERIHCLFYMFGPHRILDSDKECLKSVCGLVHVVPILAKADSLTAAERQEYLREVGDFMAELDRDAQYSVHYQFLEDRNAPNRNKVEQMTQPVVDPDTVPVNGRECSSGDADESVGDEQHTGEEPALEPQPHLDSPSVGSYEPLSHSSHSAADESTGAMHGPVSVPEHPSSSAHSGEGFSMSTCALLPAKPLQRPAPLSPHGNTTKALQNRNLLGLSDSVSATRTAAPAEAGQKPPTVDSDFCAEMPRLANIFAVVCSASESGLREYPWCCNVSAYDERVSDFRRLQRLVFEQGNIALLRNNTHNRTIALHKQGKLASWSLCKWWKKVVEPDLEFYIGNILFVGVIGVYALLWFEIWRAHVCMHTL